MVFLSWRRTQLAIYGDSVSRRASSPLDSMFLSHWRSRASQYIWFCFVLMGERLQYSRVEKEQREPDLIWNEKRNVVSTTLVFQREAVKALCVPCRDKNCFRLF